MSTPTRYEIELRGRATDRVLRPALDDFSIETTEAGNTRLTGEICDASHLNGLLAHFTSMNAEVVELRRLEPAQRETNDKSSIHPHTSSEKGIDQ
ncbi:MAG: hypothetical protein AB8G26_14035 [Ilumatobacter sp.]